MPHHDSSGRDPFQEGVRPGACIKVVSVGGGGNNAINRMIELGLGGVEFISVNTDLQSLQSSKARVRLQLGARLTHGLGTGANPEIGRKAALDESEKIIETLEGADMVFITAGLGGGTGTGVAPVVASTASQMGALTVAIVTLPFAFEGKRRMNQAERGIQHLLDHVDTLIVIPNDRLLASAKDMGFFESFQIADDVLRQAVQSISDIITIPGVINRDFADVRTTMAGMGYGVMGTASRSGPHRASDAALAAIASPLLAAGAIEGARGILINIAGSSSLKLSEVHEASTIIQRAAHEDANIIFGAVLDERLDSEIKVTVIATGFHQESRVRAERQRLMRSRVETPAVNITRPRQPPDDTIAVLADDLTTRRTERERTEPPTTANDSQKLTSSPAVPQRSAPEDQEHSKNESLSLDDSQKQLSVVGHRSLDSSLEYAATMPTEEDLLAYIEGPPFDLELIAPDARPAPDAEIPIQPEIAKLRREAMAAYATISAREIENEQPIPREDATFAEILESRRNIHDVDESNFDRRPDEELLSQESLALSGPPQIANSNEGDTDSEPDTSRLQRSPTYEMLEPASNPDLGNSQIIESVGAPDIDDEVTFAAAQPRQSLAAKKPIPDFNRKLNREPDFRWEWK